MFERLPCSLQFAAQQLEHGRLVNVGEAEVVDSLLALVHCLPRADRLCALDQCRTHRPHAPLTVST